MDVDEPGESPHFLIPIMDANTSIADSSSAVTEGNVYPTSAFLLAARTLEPAQSVCFLTDSELSDRTSSPISDSSPTIPSLHQAAASLPTMTRNSHSTGD